VLILLYLAADGGAVAERVGSLGASPSLIIYGGLYALLAAALFAAASIRSHPLRLLHAVLLAGSALFIAASERIMGEHFSYDAFITLFDSRGFVGDALGQHRGPIGWAVAVAAILFAGIALPPQRTVRWPGWVATVPATALLMLATILFARGGEGARGLPGAYVPLSYALLLAYETAQSGGGERRAVVLPRSGTPASGDIVLIVDESVGGNYLDLNAPGGARSGLAQRRPGVAMHNFGSAASITNCSVGTNLTLRHGGTRADYRRINATMPAIWDYARKAGMGTAYIDAQRTGGALQNLMTAEERAAIDRFIQFDGVKVRDRDMAAADALAALLNDDVPQFILVNKVGAHFPINDKYPDAYLRRRRALPRGGYEDISDTGSRAGFGGEAEDWRRYRNSYRNTLDWNVGAFFDRLFARADLSRATLIYTSDHGQDLHERGRPGVNTHCSGDPVMEEGLVPLVVLAGEEAQGSAEWSRWAAANRGRASHYQLFPTMLELMGYDPRAVRPVYGDPLTVPSADPMTFNILFNARLGRSPEWRKVESGARQ
jgi:hypothetical protein